jgi:hypothetical protein
VSFLNIPTTVVSAETGEVLENRELKAEIMPPHPDACQTCGVNHQPELPHNKDSLFYQYSFYAKHDRWPTWGDAMQHCPPAVRIAWTDLLRKREIKIDG